MSATTCFCLFLTGMASTVDARREYALSSQHPRINAFPLMASQKNLSAEDPEYNNKNIIVPFSNWQGPLWMNANYMYGIILKHYGFNNELDWLAQTLGQLMINDYRKYGSLHESYDADTGAPLLLPIHMWIRTAGNRLHQLEPLRREPPSRRCGK